MSRFQPAHILVPTDFSPLAATALAHAVEIARRFSSRITVLYADTFLPPIDYIEIPSSAYVDGIPQLKDATEQKLRQYVSEHVPAEVAVDARLEVDSPIHAILTVAAALPADLIVMGTHGRTGWRRALLGSVTENVLRDVDCAILTVRAGEATGGAPLYRKVLCPVNYTPIATRSLEYAASFAQAFGAELVVVNVLEQEPEEHGAAVETLREWVPEDIAGCCEFKELVLRGHPAEEVIDFAKRMGADLIVVGAQHRRFSDTTVIGTTTERITRHAHAPVLTIASKVMEEKTEMKKELAKEKA